MIKIVNFCGGRGSNSIVRELLTFPHVRIINVVNAYDDGKSTGQIRRFFRMLGPSDIRKNQIVMMHCANVSDQSVKRLFEFRLPVGIDHDEAVHALDCAALGKKASFNLCELISTIDHRRKSKIEHYLASFLEGIRLYEKVLGEDFPFGDCSIANCLYAGAFEANGRKFELAVDRVGKLLNMRGETITNSNDNRYLIGIREDGLIMNSEAEIVESRTNIRIHKIFTVERRLSDAEKMNLDNLLLDEKIKYLEQYSNGGPKASTRCLDAIAEADIILYSPGTQHSSLYPTYMTNQLGDAIRRNRDALKIFIANIGEDYETPAYSVSELLKGALAYLKQSDQGDYSPSSYVHFVLANNSYRKLDNLTKYIKHDPEEVEGLGVTCISSDFEDSENWGKHNARTVVSVIFQLFETQ